MGRRLKSSSSDYPRMVRIYDTIDSVKPFLDFAQRHLHATMTSDYHSQCVDVCCALIIAYGFLSDYSVDEGFGDYDSFSRTVRANLERIASVVCPPPFIDGPINLGITKNEDSVKLDS